ncbi:hypothetical protein [Bradyrhizobium sp. 27S5]|uniref:hypothetical protein n=1 Tax=Bradyrhizobium sp. 27S5 TaxID=3139728 RepID=UPI0030CD7F9F
MIEQANGLTTTLSSQLSLSQAPDYKQVRRYLQTVQQREALGNFMKAGWTPAELAEYARSMYLVPGQTKPTAASYRFVIEQGPDYEPAKAALATMRAPGYVMPPFDRPEPKDYEWDDPDNPRYGAAIMAAAETMARGCMAAYDDRKGRPRRGPDAPISKRLLRSCFRELHANNAFGLQGAK